jgi:hypothetical protein
VDKSRVRQPLTDATSKLAALMDQPVRIESTGGNAMPFFQCTKCGCAEDTSLSHFWSARLRETAPVCSACDPGIGKWHNEFPRQSLAEGGWIRNKQTGFLWNKGEVEDWLGQPIELVG